MSQIICLSFAQIIMSMPLHVNVSSVISISSIFESLAIFVYVNYINCVSAKSWYTSNKLIIYPG